jgi:hypothetical protein
MYNKEEFIMNPRKRRLLKLKAAEAKAAAKEVAVKEAPAPVKAKPAPVKKAFGKTKAKK